MKRLAMVKEQLESRGISNLAVLNAMRTVKREDFLPPASRILAYDDGPLPIGEGQNISQPYVVALMTSMLRPQKDLKFWKSVPDPGIRPPFWRKSSRKYTR